MFEEEKTRIAIATGIEPEDIEHIGSTAVPGLGAKPILDIMVAVLSLADGESYIRPLQTIGYEYRGELGVSGRIFFRKGEPRSHHLHMAEREGRFWEEHVLFRDYLRIHGEAVRQYDELKRWLMTVFPSNIPAYGEGKSHFINSTITKAHAERHSSQLG